MATQEEQLANEFGNPQATIPNGLPNNVKKEGQAKCFRTRVAGLSFLVKAHKEDSTLNQTVRFVPYWEKQFGDQVKVGYLKTDIAAVIEQAAADPLVEEISADEFAKATGKSARPAGY